MQSVEKGKNLYKTQMNIIEILIPSLMCGVCKKIFKVASTLELHMNTCQRKPPMKFVVLCVISKDSWINIKAFIEQPRPTNVCILDVGIDL